MTNFPLANELAATAMWIVARHADADPHIARITRAISWLRGRRDGDDALDLPHLLRNDAVVSAIWHRAYAEAAAAREPIMAALRAELSTARAALADARDHFALSEKRAQTFYDKWRTARGEGLALTEELLAARAALEERTRTLIDAKEWARDEMIDASKESRRGDVLVWQGRMRSIDYAINPDDPESRGGSGVETPPNNTEHQSNDRQD